PRTRRPPRARRRRASGSASGDCERREAYPQRAECSTGVARGRARALDSARPRPSPGATTMRAPRTLGWLALIPFMYSACASTRPSPPPSVDRKAFGLEIALCEAAAKPSAGDYAMAAGIGLVAPVATPLLFLGGVFGLTERSPLPPPPPRDSREDGRG